MSECANSNTNLFRGLAEGVMTSFFSHRQFPEATGVRVIHAIHRPTNHCLFLHAMHTLESLDGKYMVRMKHRTVVKILKCHFLRSIHKTGDSTIYE